MLIAVGVVLSFGPSTALYRWLYDWFMPLRGLRAAARFGYLYLTAIGIAAGFGLAWVMRLVEARWSRRAAAIVAAGALVLVTAEAWQGPVRTVPFTQVPPIYTELRDLREPVLLVEVPFYPPDMIFENGEYMVNATAHWRPIMNGTSGYTPDSYRRRADSFWFFPEDWAIDSIKREGATHVMVHLEKFEGQAASVVAALLKRSDLRLISYRRIWPSAVRRWPLTRLLCLLERIPDRTARAILIGAVEADRRIGILADPDERRRRATGHAGTVDSAPTTGTHLQGARAHEGTVTQGLYLAARSAIGVAAAQNYAENGAYGSEANSFVRSRRQPAPGRRHCREKTAGSTDCQSRITFVKDALQKQSRRRRRQAGRRAGRVVEQLSDAGRLEPAATDFDEDADDAADHLPEKVRADDANEDQRAVRVDDERLRPARASISPPGRRR